MNNPYDSTKLLYLHYAGQGLPIENTGWYSLVLGVSRNSPGKQPSSREQQMLNDAQIARAAAAIHAAEKQRSQARAVTLEHPDMSLDDAYRIQAQWMALKQAEGREIRGYKIGLTSRAMQMTMHIDEPDYGTLLDDMFFANGAVIDAANFTDPRIEVELAFVLKDRLAGEDVTLDDVMQATDYVIPALELIAARTYRVDPDTGYVRRIQDTISDNAASGGVILGEQPIEPDRMDLRWCGAVLYRNGVVEETGLAAGRAGPSRQRDSLDCEAFRSPRHRAGTRPGIAVGFVHPARTRPPR